MSQLGESYSPALNLPNFSKKLTMGAATIGATALFSSLVELNPERQSDDPSAVGTALEHAWKWFELHARQRLQAVDFFLVAAAFLSAGYVTALRFDHETIALIIGLTGVIFSIGFYGLESRTRELVKAGEEAMQPLQKKLAQMVGVEELELVRRVEQPKGWATYHSVIRMLYFVAIAGFSLGSFYAGVLLFCSE